MRQTLHSQSSKSLGTEVEEKNWGKGDSRREEVVGKGCRRGE
jgi:hypothetical protein